MLLTRRGRVWYTRGVTRLPECRGLLGPPLRPTYKNIWQKFGCCIRHQLRPTYKNIGTIAGLQAESTLLNLLPVLAATH